MSFLNDSVPVLCYHKVAPDTGFTPEKLDKQLSYLKSSGYETISAVQLYDYIVNGARIPNKPVMITFDDATLDNWVYSIPILNRHGFKGVFFAITSFIGDGACRPMFVDNKETPEIDSAADSFTKAIRGDFSQFMNVNEIIKTVNNYDHEVYSHSATHQMCFKSLNQKGVYPDKWHWGMLSIYGSLYDGAIYYERGSALANDGFWPSGHNNMMNQGTKEDRYKFCIKEMQSSRKVMKDILGGEQDFFCWPWGEYDELSVEALKECGYKAAFTLDRGSNNRKTDPLYIRRISVGDKKDLNWVKNKIKIYSNKITAQMFYKKYEG